MPGAQPEDLPEDPRPIPHYAPLPDRRDGSQDPLWKRNKIRLYNASFGVKARTMKNIVDSGDLEHLSQGPNSRSHGYPRSLLAIARLSDVESFSFAPEDQDALQVGPLHAPCCPRRPPQPPAAPLRCAPSPCLCDTTTAHTALPSQPPSRLRRHPWRRPCGSGTPRPRCGRWTRTNPGRGGR